MDHINMASVFNVPKPTTIGKNYDLPMDPPYLLGFKFEV